MAQYHAYVFFFSVAQEVQKGYEKVKYDPQEWEDVN